MTADPRSELHREQRSGFEDPAEALYRQATVQLAAGDLIGAVESYQRCLQARPRFPEAYNNLATALIELRHFEQAAAACTAALALRPDYVRPLVNLGKALRELGRTVEAIERLEAALALQPNYVPALINLGDALIARDELSQARAVLTRACALAPDEAMAHASLGICDLRSRQPEDALRRLRYALAREPHGSKTCMTLAHALFTLGDWPEAWRILQPRWQLCVQKQWRGSSLLRAWPGTQLPPHDPASAPPETLWVVADQGFGDTVQFSRYGPLLRAHSIATTLVVQRPLAALMRASALFDRVLAMDEAPSPLDSTANGQSAAQGWFPLMSLPALFATDPSTVPGADGYLRADPERVATWRQRLESEPRLRVGIVWQGNPRAETGFLAGRSLPLRQFGPIAALDSVALYSLQKGFGSEQLAQVEFRDRIRCFEDLDATSDAFLDSAALIANLDLVISSDTAIAHLAGALGRPVWLCLQKYPDWRWSCAPASTPWYASARLFRQQRQGDWSHPFEQIAAELQSRS